MTPAHRFGGPLALSVAAAMLAGLSACDGGDLGPPILPDGPATFSLLQAEVFDGQCVLCHVAGSSHATESGLVLEAGVAYENLVGAQPRNPGARAAGFVLVDPGEPDRSLLLHKLRWDLPPDQPSYGAPMPFGMDPLSVGQVAFVREWIAAGAPREGSVANPDLLEDQTRQNITTVFEPLPRPERGFQVHLSAFPVQPGTERELFVTQALGNEEEIWVNRVEVAMRPNSHHFILQFYLPDTPGHLIPPLGEIRDLWDPYPNRNPSARGPMQYTRRIGGAQTEGAELAFPPGVALRVPANATLDLNSHYLNFSSQALYGEVYTNLHTIDAADVDHEALPLFDYHPNFEIPPHAPGDSTVISRTFRYRDANGDPAPRTVIMLTSHTHEKGERFEVYAVGGERDGERVYVTEDWANPDIVYFETPFQVDGFRSEVTYHNPTDETVREGLMSTDEMSIIIGYYLRPDAASATVSGMTVREYGTHHHRPAPTHLP